MLEDSYSGQYFQSTNIINHIRQHVMLQHHLSPLLLSLGIRARQLSEIKQYSFVIWNFITFCSYTYMLFKLNTKASNHNDTFKTFIPTSFITNNRLHLDVITYCTLFSFRYREKTQYKVKTCFYFIDLHRRISRLLSGMMDEKYCKRLLNSVQ